VDTLLSQILNSLFYASILFLIACGLSLVYGVMRIVNMAHGNLYAFGAYVAAWVVGLAADRLHCCSAARWPRPRPAPCWSPHCCGRSTGEPRSTSCS
jgi:branched-subunit amino acid ABC-type transport system permease component